MTRQRTESTIEVGSPSVEVALEPTIRVTIHDDRGRTHAFRMPPEVALRLAWRIIESTSTEEARRG